MPEASPTGREAFVSRYGMTENTTTTMLGVLALTGLVRTVVWILLATAQAIIREYRDFRDWEKQDRLARESKRT